MMFYVFLLRKAKRGENSILNEKAFLYSSVAAY